MSEENLKSIPDDNQMGDDAYKRGAQYKWTKARKADHEGNDSADDRKDEKRTYVCERD